MDEIQNPLIYILLVRKQKGRFLVKMVLFDTSKYKICITSSFGPRRFIRL